MKCQLGDLAIIIQSDFPENVGGLVDVVCDGELVGEWGVKILQSLTANDTRINQIVRVPAGEVVGVMDGTLQPIRGQRRASPDPVHEVIRESAWA